MKNPGLLVVGAVFGIVVMAMPRVIARLHTAVHGASAGSMLANGTRVHTEEQFAFTAHGTMERVAPLFGAEKERVWAADWNPQFVHPQPVADQPGMVFTVEHHQHHAVWVNTEFDEKNGKMQYVYAIPDAMVAVITLRLSPQGENTFVNVKYERTALSAEADAHVHQMAEGDRDAGPHWEKSINEYLAKTGK